MNIQSIQSVQSNRSNRTNKTNHSNVTFEKLDLKGVEKLVIGNAKANDLVSGYVKTLHEATSACTQKVLVAIAPMALDLKGTIADVAKVTSHIKVGAQHGVAKAGAYTGEIPMESLKNAKAEFVLIGHSERRALFGSMFNRISEKVAAALSNDLTPVLCVGEKLKIRAISDDAAIQFVVKQTLSGLKKVKTNEMEEVVVAYEPVWSIGTGQVCSAQKADAVCGAIKRAITEKYGNVKVKVLYGGSVKPANAKELMDMKNIDGVLVGGACLKPDEFATIAKGAV